MALENHFGCHTPCSGLVVFENADFDFDENKQEFETYEEAEKTLELIQFPMRKPNAKIIEV
ncbi:TPA: hypothetical protein QCS28_002064 [Bacillus thuringiensis]|nr:hypothetical protein [Bacillus thuringiensis]